MPANITLKTQVQLGVVTTHFKFVGGIVPDENGKFPRDANGTLRVISEMRALCEISPVKMSIVQISFFAFADASEVAEMISGLKELGLEIHYVIMVGGANPMNPKDEDAVVAQLVPSIKSAIHHGVASAPMHLAQKPFSRPRTVSNSRPVLFGFCRLSR